MEALGQLVVAIVAFLVEVTIHAAVFIFHLVMAIFSPRYREKLRDDWATSAWRKFSIVLGVTMYSAVLIFALLFWTTALSKRTPDADRKQSPTIELSSEEVQRMKNTRKLDELVDVAGGIMKRKLAEQKEKAPQVGTKQPATRPEPKSEGGDKPQSESDGRRQ